MDIVEPYVSLFQFLSKLMPLGQITGLRVSTNNRASTVLDVLLEAIKTYGCPSRMRGDRGGENTLSSVYMIMRKGLNRGSFLFGTYAFYLISNDSHSLFAHSSTKNTRIERTWLEVATQFCRRWKAVFLRLEQLHGLCRDDPRHLWLLHFLFLEELRQDCELFRQEWNSHPISGSMTNHQSPKVQHAQKWHLYPLVKYLCL